MVRWLMCLAADSLDMLCGGCLSRQGDPIRGGGQWCLESTKAKFPCCVYASTAMHGMSAHKHYQNCLSGH